MQSSSKWLIGGALAIISGISAVFLYKKYTTHKREQDDHEEQDKQELEQEPKQDSDSEPHTIPTEN